ncbi:MAG: Na+/H+ antiporter NhaC family protein, partial [Clostridia bacterium]|nr:Na+/H+ antiporter NhaC family protein [Clostridia bacterium]
MEGTFWAFLPAIVAIVLALVTKQVYISLFLGVFVGAMLYVSGDPLNALFTVFKVMSEKVGENVPIIVFLVVLGILVVLMQKSGGARAYGDWAGKKIKSKSSALAATAGLGCLIFVDDYFNCLTVGSVMRPVTDKFKVSRAKLAYIIDSTAAPVCILAPISSWAAAVSSEVEGGGLMVFIKTIPFNVYALLTLIMVFALCYLKVDFGKMKRTDDIAEQTGDVFAGVKEDAEEGEEIEGNPKGKVRHLVIPVLILIACCIGGMIYTGFFYDWNTGLISRELQSPNVIAAFSNCDAGMSLA